MLQEITQVIWEKSTQVSPSIFWAAMLFFAGMIAAKSAQSLTISFLNKLRLNKIIKRIGLKETLSKIDIEFDASRFFGEIVKWFVVILFLMTCSEILGLVQLNSFLEKVIAYFPNIFVSALIFIVSAFLTDFSQKVFLGTLEREKITYSKILGRSARWVIWFLAVLAILYQLRVTPTLILVIFIGIVIIISLALGLAFGLGGKELAVKILRELEEKFK